MAFPCPAAQPAETPMSFCLSGCPLTSWCMPPRQSLSLSHTEPQHCLLPSPVQQRQRHAQVPPKATEPKLQNLPKSLSKWPIVWECLSHILGWGFASLSVLLLASCIWAWESEAQHPTEQITEQSHSWQNQSYPKEQFGGGEIGNIHQEQPTFCTKKQLLSSQQDLGISNPKPSLLLTQPISVLLDNTTGFTTNVPSSLRSLPCTSNIQKGNQKVAVSRKSRHVFDVKSPAFKANIAELKHALSQQRCLFPPRNIELWNPIMIGVGRDLE